MNNTNSNQEKMNLRSKMNEFKRMVNDLEDMGRESVSRCFSMDDYEDEDRENDNEYPNCVAFWNNYYAEAEKVNKFYMAHFYYNDSMTMKERKNLATHMKEFNQSVFRTDSAEEMAQFGGEDAPLSDNEFMYYRVHGAKNAFKNAKKQKVKRALQQFARRTKTSAAVSAFMGNCNQAVPELLRNTMEFVGHTGY